IRTILMEFNRVMDHLVCIGANLVEMGALTNFWYFFSPREQMCELIEACCGARLTVSYGRVGGVAQDVPENFIEHARATANAIPQVIEDGHQLPAKNLVFQHTHRR